MNPEFYKKSIGVADFKCFGPDPVWFGRLMPINVVIGRNNSGKSAIIDVLRVISTGGKSYIADRHARGSALPKLFSSHELDESTLRRMFHENTRGGEIGGNHWVYGQQLIGRAVDVEYDVQGRGIAVTKFTFPKLVQEQEAYKRLLAETLTLPFRGAPILDVSAERDVRPEGPDRDVRLQPNGVGLTNMIRAFINYDHLPRSQVEVEILRELNEIYRGDALFTRISCRESESGQWEIFLEEDKKGSIRLSQSGSSLKSIFIIRCMLRLVPITSDINMSNCIFVVEEPENNLHPSLLRRLLEFIAAARERLHFLLVVATHSPVAIEWAMRRADGKVLHVTHDGEIARVAEVSEYGHRKNILDDLDLRASDLLQANGIIWVEGPSDRLYIRNWIEIMTRGEIKEGVHYSILFYGGRLLSHLSALPPTERDELVNTLAINRNVAILIDSDRTRGRAASTGKPARRPRLNINDTKRRIIDEVSKVGGFAWVTERKEIENYISRRVLTSMVGVDAGEIDMYEDIPEHRLLTSYKKDKMSIAGAAVGFMREEDLDVLDLKLQLEALVQRIRRWNSLAP